MRTGHVPVSKAWSHNLSLLFGLEDCLFGVLDCSKDFLRQPVNERSAPERITNIIVDYPDVTQIEGNVILVRAYEDYGFSEGMCHAELIKHIGITGGELRDKDLGGLDALPDLIRYFSGPEYLRIRSGKASEQGMYPWG